EAFEDARTRRGLDALRAEQILDGDRNTLERPRLAARETPVGRVRHLERPLRSLHEIGVQRPGFPDGGNVRLGKLTRGKLLLPQALARACDGEIGERRHHSTTFGTRKKPCACCGALARILSGVPPSVTWSSRIGSVISATLAIGSTPSVLTSPSC